jgi:hypothetical protein
MYRWPDAWNQVEYLAYRIWAWRESRKRLKMAPIRKKRLLPWHYNLIHILGLASTGLILSLSLCNKVFANPDDRNLSSKLNAMQFVATVHATLLTMSLGLIMTAHACYQMSVKQGIPYGLVTAAYQLSSPEVLFSRTFWSFKWSKPSLKSLRLTWLRTAAGGAIVTAALLGPSSAVLLVPQVGYVDYNHPFVNRDMSNAQGGTTSSFLAANYDTLFPSYIDASWVPDGCDPSTLNCAETCPNAFMPGIANWCSLWVTISAQPNITVSSVTPVVRSLIASNPGLLPSGWSAATVQMLNLSRLIKALWVWNQRSGSKLSTIAANPRIELVFNAERPVLQPLVQVQCSKPVYLRNQAEIIASFEYDRIVHPNALSDTSRIPVNITINTSDWTTRQAAQIGFVDLKLPPYQSALGALIGLSFTNIDPVNSTAIERGIIPCTIDARWSPGVLIYEPVVSNTVLSSISDPGLLDYGTYAAGKPVHIDLSYANALNSVVSSYSLNNLSYTVLEYNLRWFYNSISGTVDHGLGEGTWQWMLSTMLSLQFAEALSRTNLYTDGIMWISRIKQPWNFCRNYDYNIWAQRNNASLFISPAAARQNPEQWTEVNWKTEQYVYSWSLRQTPSYLAFAVIGLHAVTVISHVVNTWFRNWQCYACKDILALVALAFQSPPATTLKSKSIGVRSRSKFAEPVRMVESEDGERIVLTVGEEAVPDKIGVIERRLVSEKQYK